MSQTRVFSFLPRLLSVAALLVLFAAASGQAFAQKDWSSLNGDWDTTFGKVHLTVDGNTVKGTYAYGTVKGSFEGTIDESGTINQSWKEESGKDVKTGKAVLKVTGEEIIGTWGFEGSTTDGKPTNEWKFTRPKK